MENRDGRLFHECGHAWIAVCLGALEVGIALEEGSGGRCWVDPETYLGWSPTERLAYTLGGWLVDRRRGVDYVSQSDIEAKDSALADGADHGRAWSLAERLVAEGWNTGRIQAMAKQMEVELVEQDTIWKVHREVSEWLSMDEEQEFSFGTSRASSKTNDGMAKRGRIGSKHEHRSNEKPSSPELG